MPKATVYNLEGDAVGEVDLSDFIFAAPVNEGLIYEEVKAQRSRRRVYSANSKTRSEVAGTRKKMYKQKGTGRARHGSALAPVFVGGGKAHGPKPWSAGYRIPRKMRQGALRSVLSLRFAENNLIVIDDFRMENAKTKELVNILRKLKADQSALIVDSKENRELNLSARNLTSHQCMVPEALNVYDTLRYRTLILSKSSLSSIEKRFDSKKESHAS